MGSVPAASRAWASPPVGQWVREPGTAGGLPGGEFIDSFLHSASQSFTQECVLGVGETAVSRKDKVSSLLETDKRGKEAHCRLDGGEGGQAGVMGGAEVSDS